MINWRSFWRWKRWRVDLIQLRGDFIKSQLCWLWFLLIFISHQPSPILANFYLMSLILFHFGWKEEVARDFCRQIFYLFWHSFSDHCSTQIKSSVIIVFLSFFTFLGLCLSIFINVYKYSESLEYNAPQTHVTLYDETQRTSRCCDREKLRDWSQMETWMNGKTKTEKKKQQQQRRLQHSIA